jgi:hypothetical protein
MQADRLQLVIAVFPPGGRVKQNGLYPHLQHLGEPRMAGIGEG